MRSRGRRASLKPKLHIGSQDAPQPSEYKHSVTITFRDSPFFGQEGRCLKVTVGKHCDLYLELSNGKRITVDAYWTNYGRESRPQPPSHRIDLTQIRPIVGLLEYLNQKLNEDTDHRDAVGAE